MWRIQEYQFSRDSGHLMFLVAAKDTQGMFYHVATVSSSSVEVAQDILKKAEKLIILSIAEDGVQERHQVQVEADHQDCGAEEDSQEDYWQSQSEPLVSLMSEEYPIMHIFILSVVVCLLVVALLVLARVVTKHCREGTEKDEDTASKREEVESLTRKAVKGKAKDSLEYYGCEVLDLTRLEKQTVLRSNAENVYISRSVVI